MTPSIDYVARSYSTNEENLLEKLFPPCSEERREHQKAICKRFSEILSFEPDLEIASLKMIGNEHYRLSFACTKMTFEEGKESHMNKIKFENESNMKIISYFWRNATPRIYDDFLSFAGHVVFPNLDEENKLKGVDIYCSKVMKFVVDDSYTKLDNVVSVRISKGKVIVNETFEIPTDEGLLLHGYYIDRRLAGFVFDEYLFYFPEVEISTTEMLFSLLRPNSSPNRVSNPQKMVMTRVKIEVFGPKDVVTSFPKKHREIDESVWLSFCIDFPENSFDNYHILKRKMEENKTIDSDR